MKLSANMNGMNKLLETNKQIQKFAPTQKGVFSLGDLKNMIDPLNKASLYRILGKLIEANIIKPFCRGFYVTEKYDIRILSQRICRDSYISFGTVLADNLMIGSIPTYRISAVKLGLSRVYEGEDCRIEQFGIKPELFMGYTNINGVNIATREKAFIDILYYYQKGMKFSYNIYSDIDYSVLDKMLLKKYLVKYNNNKFVTFVNGVING